MMDVYIMVFGTPYSRGIGHLFIIYLYTQFDKYQVLGGGNNGK